MSVEKTAEFLLVQVSKAVNSSRVCLRVGDTVVAYDQINGFYVPSLEEVHADGWTAVPLESGVLYLQASLSKQNVEALKKYCSRAIVNAWEYDKARKEALVDSLTGLLNKYALRERLTEEIARCSRRSGSFCVVFLDVDNFKRVRPM